MILQGTGDLRRVALWLGHADIQTTERYLRVDPSEKLEGFPRSCRQTFDRAASRSPTR